MAATKLGLKMDGRRRSRGSWPCLRPGAEGEENSSMSRYALVSGYGSSLGSLNGRQNLAKMVTCMIG